MARLEIEDKAFSDPRLKKLSKLMGCSKHCAFGALVVMWHDSQEEKKSMIQAEDLETWLDLSKAETQSMLGAMVASNYLEQDALGGYRIKGNTKRLQTKKVRKTTKREPSELGAGVKEAIGVYVLAFKSRFGKNPEIMGPAAGSVKNMVKSLGVRRTCEYIEAYFNVPDRYLIDRMFPLELLQTSSVLNKVKIAKETGKVVTYTSATNIETTAHNVSVAREFLERKKAKENEQRSVNEW